MQRQEIYAFAVCSGSPWNGGCSLQLRADIFHTCAPDPEPKHLAAQPVLTHTTSVPSLDEHVLAQLGSWEYLS